MVEKYHTVLVVGGEGEKCRIVAEGYGFKDVVTPATFVFADSRGWAGHQQIILDLCMSKGGRIGTRSETFDDGWTPSLLLPRPILSGLRPVNIHGLAWEPCEHLSEPFSKQQRARDSRQLHLASLS
ncbi:hypothetical protein PABG_11910 [Paracoccidioides brasiliensis Pb03]|nr:hypothetical protein PABG_11910 [Paracoccidioides brasiliensis Pb03]